ncbi:MAG: CoA transferase [Dehalococcoidia bacterium]
MAGRPLSDVVVVELATGVAGPYCGRLLSDLGAQVIKVEPEGGDWLRGERPLAGGESAFFNWLNAGKKGVVAAGAAPETKALLAHADIILHSERGLAADAIEAAAAAANPRAVVISLTPYGRSGPRASWEASELTEWATGGYHYFAGDPAREPIALQGHQAAFHAGLHAATAALAGLRAVRNGQPGQCVEISHQEAVLSDHSWLTTMWTHQGQVQRRTGSLYVPCADGYIFLFNLVPYPNLFALIERFDLLEDESLLLPANWWARFPEILAAFAEWAKTRTKQEIYHAGQELRIAMSPVNTMADVANSLQLGSRGWHGSVEAGGLPFAAPGFPYKLTGTPCEVDGPAPKLGEHTSDVLAPGFAWSNAAARASDWPHAGHVSPSERRAGPLADLRVIEVTANWAGPIGGRHLADLGADVIKVELATKPATRGLVAVADDLWPEHDNRSAYCNKLNRNKRTICLDLSKPDGKAVFLELVKRADAVIENNAARVMGNLGLDYAALAAVNPEIVMCSMAGYGATGPERNYSAYGSNIETSSGLASLLGYGPGEYFGTGTFYADPVTGNHGTVAVLAALHGRRRSGRGQWIDMSLLEAVGGFFAQPLLEYTTSGVLPEPRANRSPDFAPQDVYPSFGKDCWLALTVRDNRDWGALCGVFGRPQWAADSRFATADGRRAASAEIDAAIRAWSATLDHNHAAAALQAAGVPAAPVMANWEIVTDNHLNDRDFFVRIRHPEAGTFPFPGYPWRFEKTPPPPAFHAPRFAEHNRDVFAGLLGLSDAAIADLYAKGITADAPVYGGGL